MFQTLYTKSYQKWFFVDTEKIVILCFFGMQKAYGLPEWSVNKISVSK